MSNTDKKDLADGKDLDELGRPFDLLFQDGSISWSIYAVEEAAEFGSILISRMNDHLKAFAHISGVNGESVLDIEMEWAISDDKFSEVKALINEKPCSFDDALKAFGKELARAEDPMFNPQDLSPAFTGFAKNKI